jgi:hypothetical protein
MAGSDLDPVESAKIRNRWLFPQPANAFSNQHGDAKLLPVSSGRKAAGGIKTDGALGQLARKREVQISCAWLGWRRSELPRYLMGFQA